MALADIQNRFHDQPTEGQVERYTKIRSEALSLALLLEEVCPYSREKSLAVTKLEEAVMWANAAIARNTRLEDHEHDHIMRCCAKHDTHVIPHTACTLR